MLTGDHKMKQMGSALKFHTRYAQKDEFLDSIVTGDETWVFTTLLSPSNSHYNGTIHIPPEQINSKLQF
jgi:hypothetical protein